MKAEALLALYERVADAPDVIVRLRRFVLDLAVRGKLVEQDPKDEPASALLKRIAIELSSLLKSRKIRPPKSLTEIDDSDLPFALPEGWVWTQIGRLGILAPRVEADDSLAASFVPMTLIPAEYGSGNEHEVRSWGEIKKGYTHLAEGDVGLAKITPCFENGKSVVFRNLTGGIGAGTTELHVLRPVIVNADYVVLFLKSPQFIDTGIPRMTGTAGQKRVPTEYFTSSPFPLPPLAEQHRIVAKVDELMALLDRLEASRSTREATRGRLTTATLARLTAAEVDPESLRTHARFALDAMPALTDRADHIKHFRRAVLDLAVGGRLTDQNQGDETALEHLLALPNLSTSSRKHLVRWREECRGGVLPRDWVWLPIAALIESMDAGWSPQCESQSRTSDEEWAVLKTTAVQHLAFDPRQNKLLPSKLQPRPDLQLKVGDILVTRAGPKNRVGVSCAVDVPCPRLMISDKLIRFRLLGQLSPRYVALALNAGHSLSQIETAKSGMAVMQMNISQSKLQSVPVPLPPLAEQHRIVARVDELMGLCDRLEAALHAADTKRAELLEALLHDALDSRSAERKAA